MGLDFSAHIAELRRRLGESPSVSVIGSGSIAQQGGVAAGAGGVAIGRDVLGDVLVNSTKIVYTGADPKAAQALLNRYLKWLVSECAPLRLKAIDLGAGHNQ